VTLTTEQVIAANAARRLLDDEHFQRILHRITADAAEKTVWGKDEPTREANRQLVLAISRIRGELEADADAPEADKQADQLARAME
jgi:hypothetical protein